MNLWHADYLGANLVLRAQLIVRFAGLFRPPLINPIIYRKAKIVCNFGLSECKRVNDTTDSDH